MLNESERGRHIAYLHFNRDAARSRQVHRTRERFLSGLLLITGLTLAAYLHFSNSQGTVTSELGFKARSSFSDCARLNRIVHDIEVSDDAMLQATAKTVSFWHGQDAMIANDISCSERLPS